MDFEIFWRYIDSRLIGDDRIHISASLFKYRTEKLAAKSILRKVLRDRTRQLFRITIASGLEGL